MSMTFKLRCKACDVILTDSCYFTPDIPPKPCSDHDHPAFSDPGQYGSVDDYPETCPGCGWKVDPEWAYQQGQEALADAAEEAAEREAENRMDELRERGRRW